MERVIKDESKDFYDSDVARKFELTREIIQEAQNIIDSDKDTIPVFWKEKYINESTINWDKFYKRNSVNFFLDRHWIEKEFKELLHSENNTIYNALVVEFGCGVGNSILPLLQISDSLHFIGFDCSVRAVHLFEERWNKLLLNLNKAETPSVCNKNVSSSNEELNNQLLLDSPCPFNYCFNKTESKSALKSANYEKIDSDEAKYTLTCKYRKECNRLKTFVFDIVQGDIPDYICYPNMANYGLLIFVLSAIHPKHHQDVVDRCYKVLKSGALLLFRDYGRYDLAQLRFAKSNKSKITDNFYVRNDGTFAYYFTTEEVETLFENSGFKVISNSYCLREVTNRKTNVSMKRNINNEHNENSVSYLDAKMEFRDTSNSGADGKGDENQATEQKPVIDQQEGAPDENQYVTVKVRSPDGEQILYRIKKKTKLQKLMNSYCQRTGQNESSIRFLFEGERLRPEMTAEEAELQEGDLIDAMISQVGGACV
ncbi:hypothetical protein FG386_000514 [Cryptosporidium ryanae]|uniref:uncharacterized protein n=1 Tax=Cryptosporidium ryanae TaxID=515981 RepID=UPI00351A032A|nr:hypothetical protein FG386_000514 [Cryptosporidium ryanae]